MRKTFVNEQTGEEQEFELVDGQWTPAEPTKLDKFKKLMGKSMNAPGFAVIGAAEEGAALGQGARQLYQKAFGDEESQAKAETEEQQRRDLFNQLYGKMNDGEGKPLAATLGGLAASVGSAVIPGVGIGSRIPQALSAAGRLGRGAARVASRALGGAAGGAAQPITEGEDRAGNAQTGAALAVGIPAVAGALGETARKATRLLPQEAQDELVNRLGYRGARSEASAALRGEVDLARRFAGKAGTYLAVLDLEPGYTL